MRQRAVIADLRRSLAGSHAVPASENHDNQMIAPAPRPSPELLKLRAEITTLRRELKEAAPERRISRSSQTQEWAQIHSGPKPSEQPGYHSIDELKEAGHATPEAAFQSFLYVLRNQHKEKLTATKMKEIFDVPEDFDDPNAKYSINLGDGIGQEIGYRIVDQQFVASNAMTLTIDFEDRDGGSFRQDRTLIQRDGRWRINPARVSREN
jgi:hypothetical protein